jgi:hypothetical protein
MMAFGVGLFVGVLALIAVLVVLSSLLRAAVRLTDRILGKSEPPIVIGWDWDTDTEDDLFAPEDAKAVPELGLLRGIGFVLIAGMANLIIGVLLRFVLLLDAGRNSAEFWPVVIAAHLMGCAAGCLVLIGLLTFYVPTTFARATLATILFHVFLVVGVGIITGVVNLVFD